MQKNVGMRNHSWALGPDGTSMRAIPGVLRFSVAAVAKSQRSTVSPTTNVVFFSMWLKADSCTAALQLGHRIVGCSPARLVLCLQSLSEDQLCFLL